MFFKRFYTPGLSINSYLLGDDKTNKGVVIDPTRHVVGYIVSAQNAGLEIISILETHVHADFVSGAKELKHQLNGGPRIFASGMGGNEWIPSYVDEIVNEETQLRVGDLRLKVLHTPGHTPEHVAWVCYDESRSSKDPWFVFTGDCLFVGGVGRPDLLGKQQISTLSSQLYHSLFQVLGSLPDFVEIFPSHGENSFCGKAVKSRSSSTLGYERLYNPYLKKESKELWTKNLLQELTPFPLYFECLKKVNILGPKLVNELKIAHWDSAHERPKLDQLFLVDVRHPEVFAASFICGAINIPFSSTFSHWAGRFLPESTSVGIIVENLHLSSEVIDQLRIMGFDQDVWILVLEANIGNLNDKSSNWKLTSYMMIETEEVFKHYPSFKPFSLLDVRTTEEWNLGHIPGAQHIELTCLQNSLDKLPKDQSIALFCRSGHRASIAASLLRKNGFASVMNVRGGMQAWKQANYPVALAKK